MQLRKFYWKAHKWTEFWDSFKASVDANQSLSPVLKLEYLKTQCEGAAYQAIAGLELSDSNYEVAIDILKGRFGQRQVILNSHIDVLMKISALHKIADVSEVRRFYDTVEIHCRVLQSLGVDPKTYGTVLVNLLLQKLPEEIQLIISRKLSELHGDEDWELPKLLEILKVEIEAREKCSAGKTVPKRSGMSGHATAAALTTANTGKTNCTFCKGNHNTVECHVVTDVQERKKILRNTGRCFLCLRKAGHLARDCDACVKCFRCRGHHHVALCHKHLQFGGSEKQKGNKKAIGDENDKGRNKSSSHTTESEPQKAPNKAFCGVNTDSDSQGVLLQTAFVTAMNPQYPSQKVNLSLILDSGSQRSYVSTRVRNMLELPTIKRENIIIKTFGADETDIKTCDIVSLGLKSKHSEFYIEIKALEVPTICSPIQGQAVRWAKNQYNY